MSFLYLVYLIPVLVTCSQHTHVLASHFQHHDNTSNFRNLACPNAEDISPCTCTYREYSGQLDMDCTNVADEQELYNVFHANIPFLTFSKLILGTQNLKTLSDTVFGDVTFKEVRTPFGGTLSSVGSKTFMKSAATLKVLYLGHNELEDFPFETLSQYTQLTHFSLYANPLSSFPIIQSETLTFLELGGAVYHKIPSGGLDGLPNLESFSADYTPVDSTATELFTYLTKLKIIAISETDLVHLESLQFAVNSADIHYIDLSYNQISTIDTDAFKGIQSGKMFLNHNKLTILPEATWRPVISAGVSLWLQGNPLTCGCDVAWLVLEPSYHGLVKFAKCHSGEMLVDLDPSYFENNC